MEPAIVIIWLVGGKKAESREFKALIEQREPLQPQVVPLRQRAEDYADLAANPETGAVLISAGLSRRASDAYGPAELAAYLRTLRAALPLFLIADDPDDGDAVFDGVINPRDLRKRPEVYTARLLRVAGRYQAALHAGQRRLQELLDRQIDAALNADEADELARLRADSERAAQVKLAKHVERVEYDLVERRALVEQLESLAERLERRRQDR